MSQLPQLLAFGLALGVVYALIALGFVVIYRASRVLNFAQGEMASLGAYLLLALIAVGAPWPVAILGAMVLTGLVGMGLERGILRPLIGRPVFITAIITIVLSFAIRTIIVIVWGTGRQGSTPAPWDLTGTFDVFGTAVLYNWVGTIVAGVLALSIFWLVFKRSKAGVAMRATASDQEAALGMGIPVGRVFMLTWFIAGAVAALGGAFLGMYPRAIDPNLGFFALTAFPAVIIGGLESPLGAVLGGLVLGVVQVLAQPFLNPYLGDGFHLVFPFVVMIVVLMIRPYGLFGQPEVERV